MKLNAFLTIVIAGLGLVACADMNTLHSRQFSHQLGKQYTQLSVNNQVSTYPGLKTEYFTGKGKRAKSGDDVQPENPATWNVPMEYRPELKNAYDMLQIALIPDRKKVLKPYAAADAQVYLDCWIEQAHQHWVPNSQENDCRAAFYESFCRMYNGKCTSAISSDHIFRIYFGKGKSNITGKGNDEILKIAAIYDKGAKEVVVAGHTDQIGTPASNMKISLERANAVKARLVLAGIPENKIRVKAFGATMHLVCFSLF